MLQLKIYNKSFTPLTLLTEAEFSNLSYSRTAGEIGECNFTVRLDKEKVTSANLEHYNRIEIIEDGVVKFVGVITLKNVNLDTAQVRCRELTYILKKRLMGLDYVANGTAIQEVTDLFTAVNAVETTGITAGFLLEAVGSINSTFNRSNAFEVLKKITEATNNQFIFNSVSRTIDVKPLVGNDLSAEVIFKYDIALPSASNILQFQVEDNGNDIFTKVYGKSGAFSSTQENVGLKTQFGLLEKYRDFRVANTQIVLDNFTTVEITDRIFSPNLDLNPSVPDNFDVGDTVRVVLKNALIDIDTSYQVKEKRVQYKGNQKLISVSINAIPTSFAEQLRERDYRLELLETEL